MCHGLIIQQHFIFPENGQSLENWHHSNYQDITTDSFSSQMQMESAQICPIQQCINASIQTMNESTVTLTVLNATNTDEPTQPISFSVAQLSTPENSVDHDYCTYPRPGYSKTSHGTVGTSGPVHSEQVMFNLKSASECHTTSRPYQLFLFSSSMN